MPRANSTASKLLDELSFWSELWHKLSPDLYANPERSNVKSPAVQTTLDLIERWPKTFWEQPGPIVELAKAQMFGTATHRELTDLRIQNGFFAWQAGRYRSVVRHVSSALMRDPRWVGNLGVLSIFARSIWRVAVGVRPS